MYCPTCFNDTLKLNSRGVIKLAFDGKQKDTSLFLFNVQKETHEELLKNLKAKIEEYFKWYSSFQSKDPIKNIEVYTNDFTCVNHCKIPLTTKLTVVGLIFSAKEVHDIAKELGKTYQIQLKLA